MEKDNGGTLLSFASSASKEAKEAKEAKETKEAKEAKRSERNEASGDDDDDGKTVYDPLKIVAYDNVDDYLKGNSRSQFPPISLPKVQDFDFEIFNLPDEEEIVADDSYTVIIEDVGSFNNMIQHHIRNRRCEEQCVACWNNDTTKRLAIFMVLCGIISMFIVMVISGTGFGGKRDDLVSVRIFAASLLAFIAFLGLMIVLLKKAFLNRPQDFE